MLYEVKGDLLESDCDAIAHCCNCFHTMGAGIARQIKSAYPEAYWEDCKTKLGDINKLGNISYVKVNGRYIFNLYGQYRYGRDRKHLNESALRSALIKMKQTLSIQSDIPFSRRKIGFPKLGCNLAGGDWNVVKRIIEEVFYDTDVYIYSLE